MSETNLKAVTVYFSEAEYQAIKTEADDYEETVSAYIKARLGFQIKRRGAPLNNRNRSKQHSDWHKIQEDSRQGKKREK